MLTIKETVDKMMAKAAILTTTGFFTPELAAEVLVQIRFFSQQEKFELSEDFAKFSQMVREFDLYLDSAIKLVQSYDDKLAELYNIQPLSKPSAIIMESLLKPEKTLLDCVQDCLSPFNEEQIQEIKKTVGQDLFDYIEGKEDEKIGKKEV